MGKERDAMNHEVSKRPEPSRTNVIVDVLVWTTCAAFAIAVAASYLWVTL